MDVLYFIDNLVDKDFTEHGIVIFDDIENSKNRSILLPESVEDRRFHERTGNPDTSTGLLSRYQNIDRIS